MFEPSPNHVSHSKRSTCTYVSPFQLDGWARVVGVILASLSALSQIVFIPVFPFWALIVITLDVVVMYALVVNQVITNDDFRKAPSNARVEG